MEAFQIDGADTITHYASPKSWLWSDVTIGLILVGVVGGLLFGVFL